MSEEQELFEIDLAGFKAHWTGEKGQAEATVNEYIVHLRKYAREHGVITTLPLVRAFLSSEAKRSKHAANYASRALKAYTKWYAAEYGGTDPLANMKIWAKPTAQNTPHATAEKVDALLATCVGDDWITLRDHALISVMACTGMRRSEVARMKIADVNLATGLVVVPYTKNGEVRTTRLSTDALRSLRRYRHSRHDLYLWHSDKGGQLSSEAIRLMIERRSEKAGVKVTCHGFRRNFAKEWLRRGGSATYLQECAGWKDERMLKVYLRDVKKDEALAMHERLFG